MQDSRVEHSQCLFRKRPTDSFAVVSNQHNSWQYSSGNKKGNANSKQDGHLLPGVIDQQHMVEQMLSYGIKCQGGGQQNVQMWSCSSCLWSLSVFWCAKMRKVSYNNAGLSRLLEAFRIDIFGMVRSCHNSKEANNWEMGNTKFYVICRKRASSQTVCEGENS